MSEPHPTYLEEIEAEYREAPEYHRDDSEYEGWRACECGQPADPGTEYCSSCRSDGYFFCHDCGETYHRRHELALPRSVAGYVRTVERDGFIRYRCHDCAVAYYISVGKAMREACSNA